MSTRSIKIKGCTYRLGGENHGNGAVVGVSEAEAKSLVDAGLAEYAEDGAEPEAVAPFVLPPLLANAELTKGDLADALKPADAVLVLCPVEGAAEDAARFLAMCAQEGVTGHILAVNSALADCPEHVDLAASLETGELYNWMRSRKGADLNADDIQVHSVKDIKTADFAWRFRTKVASSAMLGLAVALLLRYRLGSGYQAVFINAQLSEERYAEYRPEWLKAAENGLFDRVFAWHFGSEPGWVAENVLTAVSEDNLDDVRTALVSSPIPSEG